MPPGRDFRLLFSLERLEAPGVRVRIMRHLFWVGPVLGFVLGCGPAPGSLCDLSTPLPRTGDQQADQNRELVRAIACMNAQSQTNAAWIGVAGAAMGAYATTQASLAESRAVQDAVFSQGLQR